MRKRTKADIGEAQDLSDTSSMLWKIWVILVHEWKIWVTLVHWKAVFSSDVRIVKARRRQTIEFKMSGTIITMKLLPKLSSEEDGNGYYP